MKCPIDGETLVMTERQGVEIDYCPKCRGVWLDRGELDKIIEKATGPMVLPDPDPAPAPQPAPRPVPQAAPQADPWSDPRADLRGRDEPRFADHGARDDWRREESHSKGRKYKGRYSDDDDDDDRHYRRKKKRKSILSEIFDFD